MNTSHQIHSEFVDVYLCMLNDYARNMFHRSALQTHAQDKVVLDMGAGTGLLSFYALEAGAKFVYCIDKSPLAAEVTQRILQDHFDQSRFKVLNVDFFTDQIDGKIQHEIDICMTAAYGPGLFDQGIFHTWHCVKPFLAKDAISIPDRLQCDLWIWQPTVKNLDQIPRALHNLDASLLMPDAVMSSKYVQSLLSIDQDIKSRVEQAQLPMPKTHWKEVDALPPPAWCSNNVLDFSPTQMPELTHSAQFYPRHIIPNISFDFEVLVPSTVAIVSSVSVNSVRSYLKDQPGLKVSPLFELNDPGQYRFTYNNLDLVSYFEYEWHAIQLD